MKKTVSKAFKHDVFATENLKIELSDITSSLVYNSNCMGMRSEIDHFQSRVILLSEMVANLEKGTFIRNAFSII